MGYARAGAAFSISLFLYFSFPLSSISLFRLQSLFMKRSDEIDGTRSGHSNVAGATFSISLFLYSAIVLYLYSDHWENLTVLRDKAQINVAVVCINIPFLPPSITITSTFEQRKRSLLRQGPLLEAFCGIRQSSYIPKVYVPKVYVPNVYVPNVHVPKVYVPKV